MSLGLILEPHKKQIIDQEFLEATLKNPRTPAVNLDTALSNNQGLKDLNVHEVAAQKAREVSEALTVNNPGLSEATLAHMKTVVEAAVKYNAVASEGKLFVKKDFSVLEQMNENLKRRRKAAQAAGEPMAMTEDIGQKDGNAARFAQPQNEAQAIAQAIPFQTTYGKRLTEANLNKQVVAPNLLWDTVPIQPHPLGAIAIDQYRQELSEAA